MISDSDSDSEMEATVTHSAAYKVVFCLTQSSYSLMQVKFKTF